MGFRQEILRLVNRDRIPNEILFPHYGRIGENDKGIEPGVYTETNIPRWAWETNEDIRVKTGMALTLHEGIQKLLGSESVQGTIPLSDGVSISQQGVKFEYVATVGEGKHTCVCLKVERADPGAMVVAMNRLGLAK
ncbi:hypothetical protein A2363_03280 [Candidatus Gottesmanbacteria bacterium RIFOXYB1_FULL_47_11]|uniref:Uncharacterized protein n=1 Tax=Candidatus Gottesmanbacteria bacterium RIFOXYB1_FULL_47_11 TaxID=1798401 RepID=A0A1F6BDB8_9BACT|nr:MAG: hypothetical protein A2363_03280 [Candidatus Gottesmanbacteria bacterium RIFOXYB1_FULL_47_11]